MVLNGFRIKEEFREYFYISIIIIFIIVLIILWYFYNKYIFKCLTLSPKIPGFIKFFPEKPNFGKDRLEISVYQKNDNMSDNYSYTISCFIYLLDWKYKYYKNKDFLKKGNKSIEIYLEKEFNNLIFKIFHTSGSEEFTIKNVDINRWFHFMVGVQNEQVDLYYNGKLYSSHVLPNLPKMNNNNIILCDNGGFNGLMYDFKYIEKPISLSTVENWSSKKLPLNQKFFKIDN